MRVVTLSLLIVAVAGCNTAERHDWVPKQAAKINYDGTTDTFTLANLSDAVLWFDRRAKEGPAPEYWRLAPTGWVRTGYDGCGTSRDWQPLASGGSISLGKFYRRIDKGCPEAEAFVGAGGDLDALPARVGIRVTCNRDRDSKGETVFSEQVVLPRAEK
jgi:hypothetical protein